MLDYTEGSRRCACREGFFSLCVSCADAGHVKITLPATTDLHGNILPYDYFAAKPTARGLAKIAAIRFRALRSSMCIRGRSEGPGANARIP